MKSVFFHIDIDAFYANVEILDNPKLKGKPVIVGGSISRGVVSTCSYEARRYGVHSGMPLARAKKICPVGIFLPTRMKRYNEKSKEVMSIIKSYTPDFQQISVDEGFLNMSGMELLLGKPYDIAKKIKIEVLEKTKLPVSIGIASTKYFAKLASNFSKPNGLYEIKSGDEKKFIKKLPLKKIWGLGKKTIEKLNAAGIITTENLFELSLKNLQNILGKAAGKFLYDVITANIDYLFNEETQNHSISTETTFENDITNTKIVEDILFELSSEISFRMIFEKVSSNTVFIKIRYSDFKTFTIQETGSAVLNTLDLFTRAKDLFYRKYEKKRPIRLLGLGVLKVTEEKKNLQAELFQSKKTQRSKKQKIIEQTAFKIAKKTGKNILTRARLIDKPKKK